MNANQKDFIFIVGCPRSGTFLLSTILNSQFSIAIPVETHFIPLFKKFLFLWGDLRNYKNRQKLLNSIYDFLEIWTPLSNLGRDLNEIKKLSLLVTKYKKDYILEKCESYAELVTQLFYIYAQSQKQSNWADKSAFFYHIPLEKLALSLENRIKVIHIIRDGRDVSLSWMKIWTGPETLASAAQTWKTHIEEKRKWGQKNPDHYLEIKYEELLDNPKLICQKLSSFLKIKKYQENLNFENSLLANTLSKNSTHPLLSKPLDKNNQEKWKQEMDNDDIQLFEDIAGSTLVSCGYPIQKSKPDFFKRAMILAKITSSKIINIVSLRQMKLRLKSVLPVFLFLCSTLNIPIVKIMNRRI